MQCAYCGATLKPDEKVCSQCGAEVAPANHPAAPAQEEPIPEAFPYAEPGAQTAEPSKPATGAEPVTPAPVSLADVAAAAANTATGSSLSVLAYASLVLGVLSLCGSFFALCGAPISVIGIILGILSLKSSKRGLAVGGIALNGLGLLMAILFTLLIGVSGYFSSLHGN
jgi:nucleoid-associated protein YgaU